MKTIDTAGELVAESTDKRDTDRAPAPAHHEACTPRLCHPECMLYLSQFTDDQLEGLLREAEGTGRVLFNLLDGEGSWIERVSKAFK